MTQEWTAALSFPVFSECNRGMTPDQSESCMDINVCLCGSVCVCGNSAFSVIERGREGEGGTGASMDRVVSIW